jgi:hypothetical protein
MARFQFGQQQAPYQQLQGFLSPLSTVRHSAPLRSSNTPQAQTNRFGQALGGAVVLVAQVGSMIGGIGGLSGSHTGAILGGLGGLLLLMEDISPQEVEEIQRIVYQFFS